MDTEWDKMKKDYGMPAVTESFNPVAKGDPNKTPDVKVDPNKPLGADAIGAKAVTNATARFGDGAQKTNITLNDPNSVRDAVGGWAEKLTHSDNAAVKAAASDLLGKMQNGALQGAGLVNATNDFQNALVKAGYKMDSKTPDGQMIENISMATQAFATDSKITVDPKLYHTFQPDDGLTPAQVGIAAPTTVTTKNAPGAPGNGQ
jgi:hypothetical protein